MLHGVFVSRDEIMRAAHYFLVLRDETLISRDETLVSRDETLVSRDETLVSRDETLVSRDETLVSREGGNLHLTSTVVFNLY